MIILNKIMRQKWKNNIIQELFKNYSRITQELLKSYSRITQEIKFHFIKYNEWFYRVL